MCCRMTAVDFQTVQFAHIVSDIVLIAQVQGVLRILKSSSQIHFCFKDILGFWLKSPDSVTIGYWYLN